MSPRTRLTLKRTALLALPLTLGLGLLAPSMARSSAPPPAAAPSGSLFSLSAKGIGGQVVDLKTYEGKVVLVVNVASQCGFTKQYDGLQKLYTTYKDKGLVVLGFPSNEFGGQEPGTEAEIQTFCSTRFGVTFPMFAKVQVKKGPEQSPVYSFLTQSQPEPKWNFTKYLVGKNGQVVASFPSNVAPESPKLVKAIEDALK